MAGVQQGQPELAPALLQRLFEANPDGLWLIDDDGVTTWANDAMARILGREPAEMVGLRVVETLDEQGRADFARALARMVASGEGAENIDAHFCRPDGTSVWGLVSFTPVPDDDGIRMGWLHRVTPYTERKKLADAVREREHQLAQAQRIAHLGSWEWDVAADRLVWSAEMCRIFGVEPGTSPDYPTYLQLLHPADRERVASVIESAARTGEGEFGFDHRVLRPDGEVRWVRGTGLVERDSDGVVVRMSGTGQDITDLHTAVAQAAEANRRLSLLQEVATTANRAPGLREALLMASAGVPVHTTWSPVCAYLYDDSRAEPELLNLGADERPVHADPVHADPVLAETARATQQVTVGTSSRLAEAHSLVAMPVVLDGEVICVVELIADELPPDEHSHQLMDQISRQLGLVAERERRAAQLAEARDDAMEASRLKSQFLATMSHEIRTPMNGVIGLTDLLLRTDLDEHQRRLATSLQEAGMTLLGVISDILDLSKIEAGKLELEVADFDVRTTFDQVASVLSGPAHEKGLELVVACHPDVPVLLRGDPVRFGQVVTNLGSNAVKFTDSGEVVIEARVERQTPRTVVLRIDVTDTGVGIAASERERLFEAFTQADPSTTRRHGGTGLGLAISRQLVEALGGELWVTSEPGAGSTFSFTAELGRVIGAVNRRFDVPVQLRGRRVLIVDDNQTNRLILEGQLAAWHMRAFAVASADEAVSVLHEAAGLDDPFEVIVLDLRMPGTDGLELARTVRADTTLPQVEMLLLSSEQVSSEEVADAGIRANLSKPVRQIELHDTLVDLLTSRAHSGSRRGRDGARSALGIRVLVVEDNPVNQLVATGLLESLGCTVDLADDGIAAVARLTDNRKDHGYDAVLMDCRMPRLDGFDATRRIRAQEPPGQRIPIIAMTASAMEGERERCLDAGMDDYLTKPVDAAELERTLRAWTQLPIGSDVLDEDRMQMLAELVKDGTSFLERTATSFMARVNDELAAIRTAVEGGDAVELLAAAHRLKGGALNLGLPRVAEAAARLEALGEAGRTSGATPVLDRLTTEVEVAVSALQRTITQHN